MLPNLELSRRSAGSGSFADPVRSGSEPRAGYDPRGQTQATELSDDSMGD